MVLHIDIETFSSAPIRDVGAYKYTESPDFEILMVAFAFNDEPIEIIDLARGEDLPKRFTDALLDPKVEKWAHNATFERRSFIAHGYDIPIDQWFCSAIKSAYCGYPLGLDAVSQAMDLGDKGKLATGRALIRYFCIPTKPTKANGGRTRNLPHHDPEKWEEFKLYCINDVEAEREITNRLSDYEIPQDERDLYILDQEINDRGILVDTVMAQNAIALDDKHSAVLFERMVALTGLDNPNSPKQIAEWLSAELQQEVTSIAKGVLTELLATDLGEVVREVINLRLHASKTSTKKYEAMIQCAGDDGRAHGLFQFYGASRTGRWAGRLIQLQNLPRNYIKNLEEARGHMRELPYGTVSLLYDNISDVQSQLIRTALIAPQGKTFVVADFSAIEARVIAWYADETWRLDVFASHGKIYEASAAMMFDMPLESIAKDSKEREKGKIAELALGYQGSLGALKQMGGEQMGLTDAEMKEIVRNWRAKSPNIVSFWYAVDEAVKVAIQRSTKVVLGKFKNLIIESNGKVLTISLPSGRQLFYQSPQMTTNRFGGASVRYRGMNQTTRNWEWVESYGGKFVENIVQATARDLLAHSMIKIDALGYPIVMHVHDEVAIEEDLGTAEERLEELCNLMGEEVPWAKGLVLTAAGYTTTFYKKD